MSRRINAKTFVTLAALLVLAAPVTRAQNNCQSFRALLPLTYNDNTGWGGPVYAMIDSEVLIGKWTTEVPPQTSCDGVACQDTASRSRIDFGGSGLMNPGDTLVIELQTAQYPIPDGYAVYHAMWKIVGGTDRFAEASGVGFENGPFLAWMDAKNIPQGQYNGEVEADICRVKPATNPQATSSRKPLASMPASARAFFSRQFSPSVRK